MWSTKELSTRARENLAERTDSFLEELTIPSVAWDHFGVFLESLRKGRKYMQEQRYKEAVAEFEIAHKHNP